VFYLGLVAVTLLIVYWAVEAIVRSPWGRVLKAIREDEVAAQSLGKNVLRYRLEALMLGAGLMGLSGALYVGFIAYISPFDFMPIVTFQIWTMLVVGGAGSNRGAIAGAVVVCRREHRPRFKRFASPEIGRAAGGVAILAR
jgi:branched-chain amino acid transport system permease protein